MKFVLFLLVVLTVGRQTAAASSASELHLEVRVSEQAREFELQGTLKIKLAPNTAVACLYLPYNDNHLTDDFGSIQHLKSVTERISSSFVRKGHTSVSAVRGSVKAISDDLLELSLESGEAAVAFTSTKPKAFAKNRQEQVFDGYYPQLLEQCPEASTSSRYFAAATDQMISGRLQADVDWQLVPPLRLTADGTFSDFRASRVAFALTRGMKEEKIVYPNGDTIRVHYSSEDFARTIPTIKESYALLQKWLGPFPYPELVVLETGDLESPTLPALVTINKARQTIFHSLQTQVLNFNHWALVTLMAKQWYGSAIAGSPDDDWFLQGTVDYLAYEVLRQNTARYNLFNVFDLGYSFLSLNYMQAQDLTASLLNRLTPNTVLTKDDLTSARPLRRQHPLLFIKHALAMRHLDSVAGTEPWQRFMRGFTQKALHQRVVPREFHDALAGLPSPFSSIKRKALQSYLAAWWRQNGWPDYALETFERVQLDAKGWVAEVAVGAEDGFAFPVPVKVTDSDGQDYLTTAEPQASGKLKASVVTKARPESAVIAPYRSIYDVDRFDNSSEAASINFFPGSATTLKDDAYTVVWLPYVLRRPGERAAAAVQANLFRYVASHTFLRAETALDGDAHGYALAHRQKFGSSYAVDAVLEKNFEDHQVSEVSFSKEPVNQSWLPVGLGVRGRMKGIIAEESTYHKTYSLFTILNTPGNAQPCHGKAQAEAEAPFSGQGDRFRYERKFISLAAYCNIWDKFDTSIRLFRGELTGSRPFPKNVLFVTEDLREAHLRLDRDKAGVEKILAVSTDLFFPAPLPIAQESLLLSRQFRLRVFGDYGKDLAADTNLYAAGGGFVLPLGGDLVATGTLAVSRLSFLVVAYSQVGDDINKSPKLLVDISGEL